MTKLTDLPVDVLNSFWPANQTIIGILSCRRLRDVLPTGAHVVLRTHSDSALDIRWGSLLRFKGKVDLKVTCILPKTPGKQLFPCQVYPIEAMVFASDRGWRSLVRLDLSGNEVKLQGIKKLCPVLPNFDGLTHLRLGGNKICVAGAGHLARTLPQCHALTHLDLGNNMLGSSGASQIAGVMPSCNISSLDLSSNSIGCGGAIRIASVLPICDTLSHLDLSANDIYSEGCRHLAMALPLCSSLASFNISSNRIQDAGAGYLQTELPSCPNLTDLKLAECSLSPLSQAKLASSLNPTMKIDFGWMMDPIVRRELWQMAGEGSSSDTGDDSYNDLPDEDDDEENDDDDDDGEDGWEEEDEALHQLATALGGPVMLPEVR